VPLSLIVDASGRCLYVVTSGTNQLYGYSIDQTSGQLTMMPWAPLILFGGGGCGSITAAGTPITTGILQGPVTINTDQFASFLFTANGDSSGTGGTLSEYSINSNSGALTTVNSAVAAGAAPYSLTFSYPNTFMYVADKDSSAISGYQFNGGGTVTPISITPPATYLARVVGITSDPHSNYYYVVSEDNGIWLSRTAPDLLREIGS